MESACVDDVPQRYARFARNEVRDRNPVLRSWSEGVAADPETAERIATLPSMQRQPVLVFAAARFCGAADDPHYPTFRDFLHTHWTQIAETTATHSTQTNEARRIGCLLPFLASAAASNPSGQISLLEVGASAGLCLYPDRYAYRFFTDDRSEPFCLDPASNPFLTAAIADGEPPAPPVLDISMRGMIAPPRELPKVAYRGGVDLNPINPADPESRDWLTALIWPGQEKRVARLHACLDIAAAEPADILRGDAVARIGEAVERARAAAPEATPVVFHTAVLAYLEPAQRREFAAEMQRLKETHGAVWISSEGLPILPDITAQLPTDLHNHPGLFAVAVNGTALATTHGHGDWVRSLD